MTIGFYVQLSKQIPAVDDPQFHSFYMKTFYSKLNKYCFAVINKKLKDLSTCASNCITDDFKRWIDDPKLTERMFLAFSRNNQPPRHGKKKIISQTNIQMTRIKAKSTSF